jgi:DNA-binding PadR family transcriptional regulator
MQEIAWRTDNQVRMGPGTLYGTIKRMLAEGLIEESSVRPDPQLDDERRRYYRLTNFGQRVVRAEARRLEQLVRVARGKRLLQGDV